MEHSSSQILEGRSDCKSCVQALIDAATMRIYLITQHLEPEVYNYKEIYQSMTALVLENKKADIRILTHDSRIGSYKGHYLIQLAQKLPSFVQVRTTVTPIHQKFGESWLIVDDAAFMRIKVPSRFEGYFDTDNRLDCRSMIDTFKEMWEASDPDQNTRRLNL